MPITRIRRLLPILVALSLACAPEEPSSDGADPDLASGGAGTVASPPPDASGEGQDAGEAGGTGAVPAPGSAWVIFGSDTVRAEVARTPEQRARGLMYRENVPEGTGMLFTYPEEGIRSFWMQNTYVPLDIAFLDSTLRVVDIQTMEPLTTDFYESRAPAMFALEVPAGWFEAHGIGVGARAELEFGAN